MTRKDFGMIAKIIRTEYKDTAALQRNLAIDFGDALEKHAGNANFDKARFIQACGVKS